MTKLNFPILRKFNPASKDDITRHFSKNNAAKLNALIERINKQVGDINLTTRGQKFSLSKVTRAQVNSRVTPIIHMSFKSAAIATPYLKTFLEIANDEFEDSPKVENLIKNITTEVNYFLGQFTKLKSIYNELKKLINDHFEETATAQAALLHWLKELEIPVSPEQSKRIKNLTMEGTRHVIKAAKNRSAIDVASLDVEIGRAEKLALTLD